jgi:DNA-binding MarR family transcriptional regulator
MLAGKQIISGRGMMTVLAATGAISEERERAERAARLRAAVGRLNRGLRSTQAGAGLTPSQISVLFTIVRRGPLGLSELASIEDMNPTMLSRITAQLGERGLISRHASAQDRRAAVVESTAAGRRMRERIQRERARALEAHVERLEESQREQLWQALPALEQLAATIAESRR